VYGRLVRPGPTVNQILDRRAYPSAVSPYGVGLYETRPVRSSCLRFDQAGWYASAVIPQRRARWASRRRHHL